MKIKINNQIEANVSIKHIADTTTGMRWYKIELSHNQDRPYSFVIGPLLNAPDDIKIIEEIDKKDIQGLTHREKLVVKWRPYKHDISCDCVEYSQPKIWPYILVLVATASVVMLVASVLLGIVRSML